MNALFLSAHIFFVASGAELVPSAIASVDSDGYIAKDGFVENDDQGELPELSNSAGASIEPHQTIHKAQEVPKSIPAWRMTQLLKDHIEGLKKSQKAISPVSALNDSAGGSKELRNDTGEAKWNSSLEEAMRKFDEPSGTNRDGHDSSEAVRAASLEARREGHEASHAARDLYESLKAIREGNESFEDLWAKSYSIAGVKMSAGALLAGSLLLLLVTIILTTILLSFCRSPKSDPDVAAKVDQIRMAGASSRHREVAILKACEQNVLRAKEYAKGLSEKRQ